MNKPASLKNADLTPTALHLQHMKDIVTQIPFPVIILNIPSMDIAFVNDAALTLGNSTVEQVCGEPYDIVFPWLKQKGTDKLFRQVIEEGIGNHETGNIITIEKAIKQNASYFRLAVDPVKDDNAVVCGIMITLAEMPATLLSETNHRDVFAETENDFRHLANALPQLVWVADAVGRVLYYNNRVHEYKNAYKDSTGKWVWEGLLHPVDLEPTSAAWSEAVRTGTAYEIKHRVQMADGNFRWHLSRAFPEKDVEGNIVKWFGTATDIHEQKEYEESVARSEKKYRNLIQETPAGIIIFHGRDFIVDAVNKTYLDIIDKNEEELRGKKFLDVLPELRTQGIAELLNSVMDTGIAYHGNEFSVVLNRYGKREVAYFNFVYAPLNEDNKVTGVIVVCHEITELVRAKHLITESEQELRRSIMQSAVGIVVLKGEDFIIDIANNKMLQTIWRKEWEEVANRKLLEVFPELNGQPFPELLKKVFATGVAHKDAEAPVYIESSDGNKLFYVDFEYMPLTDNENNVTSILVTVNDVTERVESKQRLEISEMRSRLAMHAASLGTYDWDFVTNTFTCSPRVTEIFGHPAKEATHELLKQCIHPGDIHIRDRALLDAFEKGSLLYEVRVVWPDGSIHWVKTSGVIIFNEQRQPLRMYGTVMDITEQKQSFEALAESEERFKTVAHYAPVMIWKSGPSLKEAFFNKSWLRFTGRTVAQEAGNKWMEYIFPEDKDAFIKKYNEAFNNKESFNTEFRLLSADGTYRWISFSGVPLFYPDGSFRSYMGSCIDIQNIRENEQRKNDFIKMASHELKTPITSIKGYSQLLINMMEEQDISKLQSSVPFVHNSLKTIDKQIDKLTRLVSELLDLNRIESGRLALNKSHFCLAELISESAETIQHTTKQHTIVLKNKVACTVYADRDRISQVLLNILANAVKYSPAADKIEIWMEQKDTSSVSVHIKDFGIGINKHEQEKIFDRFFRSEGINEQTYPGFGIGLFIASEIMKRHEGTITVCSQKDKGSEFVFTLPLSTA